MFTDYQTNGKSLFFEILAPYEAKAFLPFDSRINVSITSNNVRFLSSSRSSISSMRLSVFLSNLLLVWPPINRTIVIEVDTNINFSADICIGKEQPTAINYTDSCWYGTSGLNLVVLCFSLTVTLTFPIRHCDQKCIGERFAVEL